MLSEAERREVEEELKLYDHKRAACVEALKIVQKHRGWVPDEGLRDLAEVLEMTPEELDGVATCYSLIYRRPVGRHVILICDSVTCWIMDYQELRDHLKARWKLDPGGTTADGRFTLLPVACLGACDHAPVMMVDEDLHLDLTTERIDQILGGYL